MQGRGEQNAGIQLHIHINQYYYKINSNYLISEKKITNIDISTLTERPKIN